VIRTANLKITALINFFFPPPANVQTPTITMPVTIRTAHHAGNKYPQLILSENADKFFENDKSYMRSADHVLSSTFDPKDPVVSQPCGFVSTVLRAYAGHHHLVIRPDDIWITIICQLSFYINAHAEELRKKFVAHEKKKTLKVFLPQSTVSGINWDHAGDAMIDLMHKDLVDKELKNWVIPEFSTTTRTDKTVSAMLMMCYMKAYYSFIFHILCGIPTITLEGTKEDWVEIQKRLEKLDTWDDKTRKWHSLLKPVLKRFIAAFEKDQDKEFWSHIVSVNSIGCGSKGVSGWITAFCAFDERGRFVDQFAESYEYALDGISYPCIDETDLPPGSAEVDALIIDDFGQEFETVLIAGNIGMRVIGREDGDGDTVESVPMWCFCLKSAEKMKEQEEEQKRERKPWKPLRRVRVE
jgi:hypothetical protein